MPKFAPSVYSDNDLIALVRDVCRTARPLTPLDVSEREFDASRVAAGHPDAPGAQRIGVRLNRGWPEVKQVAFERKRNLYQTVAVKTRAPNARWISSDACVFALQIVAARLEAETLSPSSYDDEADRLRAERRRRHRHGRIVIPTSSQIIVRLGTWAKALKAAGLKQRPRTASVRGIDYVAALELCLEETGTLPTARDLRIFIRAAHGLMLEGNNRHGLAHEEAIRRLREQRAQDGKWTPPGYEKPKRRPDYTKPVGISGPTRVRGVEEEGCVQYLMRFLIEIDGGKDARAAYVVWSSRTPGAPAASTMNRGGKSGFAALRAEAWVRLRRGELPIV